VITNFVFLACTSSIIARHFALNSPAPIVFKDPPHHGHNTMVIFWDARRPSARRHSRRKVSYSAGGRAHAFHAQRPLALLRTKRRDTLTQENATVVRRFADEVITQGESDRAVEFVGEDVVEQVPLPRQGPGIEGLKEILRAMHAGFPDLVFSIQEQIADGEKVVSRCEWTGTHHGESFGVPATGKPVRVWGMVIDRLEAGRIKDTRIIMDTWE
jgi:steroid delta-isomerase-like uncharacterized protein